MSGKTPNPPVGSVFGRLTVISDFHVKGRDKYATCRCSCGTERVIAKGNLISGRNNSCGCLRKELSKERRTTHGMSYSSVYPSWVHMINRCQNPENENYHYYGGRGIKVCSDWQTVEGFHKDMGDRPFKGATLERLDTNLGYCKSNCVWADMGTQTDNTRRSVRFEYKGKLLSLKELAKLSCVGVKTLSGRLYDHNWPVELAVDTPVVPRSESNKLPRGTTPATRHKLYPQP